MVVHMITLCRHTSLTLLAMSFLVSQVLLQCSLRLQGRYWVHLHICTWDSESDKLLGTTPTQITNI